ncbi:MAG: TonB-dependent receptor [Ignavibacteria bacterium]
MGLKKIKIDKINIRAVGSNSLVMFFIFILMSSMVYSQGKDSGNYKTKEIKVFSNKITTDKFNSPTKVQLIDRTAIRDKNGETLSDVLQIAGGVYVKSYGGNYSLNTVSMNGLGSEHTLILLNGFKLNSSQNNQLDLNSISKDNIEEIEVLNNGSSSIYGSEAIGGVINIITKNNSLNDLSLKLNGQIGSYDQRKIYVGFEKTLKDVSIGINYSNESSLNNYKYYFDTGAEYLLKERANSDYDVSVYSADISYNDHKNSLIKYYFSYTDQFRNIPGIETGSAPSPSDQRDKNWNNVLSFDRAFNSELSFKSQINFQNNLSHYFDGMSTSYYKNTFMSNTSQLNITGKKYEFVTGYEASYSNLKSNETQDLAERIQPSVFLVSQVSIGGAFKVFPSVRYDYISDIRKNVVSGKLGLNFKPFKDQQLNLKASAGNNYAAPTFNELYWKDLGNKNLKPEKSLNADIGAIYNFNLFTYNTIEMTYSYTNAADKIVWSPNSSGLYTPKNIGKSSSNVILIDLSIQKIFSDQLSANVNLNYSYTSSLKKSKIYEGDPTFDKQIFYIPTNMAKCNLNLKYGGTGLNLYYTYTGKRFTNFENTDHLPPVNLIDGNIYKDFNFKELKAVIKFEMNNILNESYQIISGYPMPLRNVKLVLSIEY